MTLGLRPLRELGINPAFFRLAASEEPDGEFDYYTFGDGWPVKRQSHWNLIGVRRVGTALPLLDVRHMEIEEEMLEWPEFAAPRDAPGYLSLSLEGLDVLIDFLAEQGRQASMPTRGQRVPEAPHFTPFSLTSLDGWASARSPRR